MKLNKMDPVDLLNAANIQDPDCYKIRYKDPSAVFLIKTSQSGNIHRHCPKKRLFRTSPPPPPPHPQQAHQTIVCKITLLCGAISSLVFFQHIAFKLGNFSDFEVFFSVVLTGFCYLIPVKSRENKKPWKVLLIKALVFHAVIK